MLYLTKKTGNEDDGRVRLAGAVMLTVAAFIWGTSLVSQSGAMASVGPFTFTALRSALGGIALLVFYIFFPDKNMGKSGSAAFTSALKGGMICGTVLFFSVNFQQIGLIYAAPGKAAFITALYIVIVPIIGTVLGRQTKNTVWISVGIALVGFYLLNITPGEGFGLTIWEALILLCAVAFSAHILAVENFGAGVSSVLLSCIQFLTVSVLSSLFIFFDVTVLGYNLPDAEVFSEIWFNLLYAGLFSCGIAFTLQIAGQKCLPSSSAALILSLESVFAAATAWLVSPANALGKVQIAGCILIFAAICFSSLPFGKGREINPDH